MLIPLRFGFSLFLTIWLLIGCGSSIVKDTNSAEGHFKYAQALADDERYEEAIIEHQEVKNKHPYSRFAVLSELAIADIHYKREAFIEAQSAYEIFKSLHPKNERIDHVTFRLGMSFFQQLPSTVDRDLSLARNAILYFDEVLRSYPNSTYQKEATEKRLASRKMLAEKEFYIADFYYKQEKYQSSLGRYESILELFENLGFEDRALFGAARSSFRSGALEKGKKYYSELVSRYPDSEYTTKIKEDEYSYVKN